MKQRPLRAFLPVTTVLLVTGMLLAPVAADASTLQAGGDSLLLLSGASTTEWSAPHVRSMPFSRSVEGTASISEERTDEFSLLGVTWTNPNASVGGTIQVRTRQLGTGAWSGWTALETTEKAEESDPGVHGGTDPLWVGPSDGVDVRVLMGRTESAGARVARLSQLPKGLSLSLVDPGRSTDSAQDGPAGWPAWPSTPWPASAPDDAATPSGVAQPPIIDRAGWGADESISPEAPVYLPDAVKAVVVHHTAGTNNYSCTNSAALIRGIYNYDVLSRGYRDIGYNFLVDKCGTIFEGRKGGVDQAVYGAHARGWNSQTVGVSVLGNFNTAVPTTATLTALARIAAWKLGQYDADPAGTVSMVAGDDNLHNYYSRYFTKGTAYTFPRIVGHRDVNNTECPGTNLYAKLPTIRAWAAGPAKDFKVTSLTGASKSGSTYYTTGGITLRWSTSTPSPLLTEFDLIVDDIAVATVAGSARTATFDLPVGSHQIQVRAVHVSGKPATTPRIAVVAETTPPRFTTAPGLSLRTGTVNTSAVPVRLAWRATDNAALRNVQLTTPTALTFVPATLSWPLAARSGTATTWAMKANDFAGNTAPASTTATPVILQETSAVRSGTWRTKTSTNYLGGKSYTSSTKGSALTWTFTGRSAAWIVSRATGSGQALVYVDGIRTATVDLYSATTRYRNAIWTKTWPTNAKHTVKIVVAGTRGRPALTTDGLVYLR